MEAKNAYNTRYKKENMRQFSFWASKKYDKDIIEFIESLENRTEYIKKLIRDDMKKSGIARPVITRKVIDVRAMLKCNTNMSKYDIERHVKDGVLIYENFDEFREECLAGLMDEEDIQRAWDTLDTMMYQGKSYKVDFVL